MVHGGVVTRRAEPRAQRARYLGARHRRLLWAATFPRALHPLGAVRPALSAGACARHHAARAMGVWRGGARHLPALCQTAHSTQSLSLQRRLGGGRAGLADAAPLVLEYRDDPIAAMIDDAYLLGPALLIAPVFSDSREPVARRAYLPAGTWIDFWTDERVSGGRFVTREAPLDTLPLYVRAGTILPLGPERAFIGDDAPENLTLEVYPGAEGSARVVWDAAGAATELGLRRAANRRRLGGPRQREASLRGRWHTEDRNLDPDPRRAAPAA